MSDLRNIFTSRDFVINSNIVKCISSIDITLEEFLLVLYFINISSLLNTDDIKDWFNLNREKMNVISIKDQHGDEIDEFFSSFSNNHKNKEIK